MIAAFGFGAVWLFGFIMTQVVWHDAGADGGPYPDWPREQRVAASMLVGVVWFAPIAWVIGRALTVLVRDACIGMAMLGAVPFRVLGRRLRPAVSHALTSAPAVASTYRDPAPCCPTCGRCS